MLLKKRISIRMISEGSCDT